MTDILLYILGILIILAGLALSIGLHELGHLIPAKIFGVKVTQYMVGFGRTLWSKRRGETEYGIKAIPLGGYVAMIGMYPPGKPGEEAREATTGFLNTVVQEGAPGREPTAPDRVDDERRRGIAGMVDEARLASAETIDAGEDHRAFYRLSVWKKIVIMLGGPLVNLLLAGVFFAIVLSGFGVPQDSTTIGSVSRCLVPASSEQTECGPDTPSAPAAAAGLLPGDRLLSVDGEPLTSWLEFRAVVGDSPSRTLTVLVDRDGEQHELRLTPVANERYVVDDSGNVVEDASGEPVVETVGMIGATAASELARLPVTEVPAYVGDTVVRVANVFLQLPQRMVDVWQAAFGSEERDPDGPISVVGVGRLAGEIVSMEEQPIAAKAQNVIGILGSLNVALFVFNLIPLMPLDGGHIAGAVYEWLKRGLARLRRKPDPGPIDTAKMVPVTFAVVVVLVAMSALLMYADIVKPVAFF